MRIIALIAASAAALSLAACNKAEEKAPDASTEAVEASGIADQAAVDQSVEQTAADAKAAADASAASEMAQAEPAPAAAPAPATPVEAH
ncbi:putative low-complexity protein [Brevundimonas alba]|uniref:Putative low-complexity protein n=1 Tax=Brevundimonas alba TaxID=74314 RepID=A0A7X5YI18_9CAUL|nr:hypothetical protein [Brevundimonas alba]NJC40332.1 putative low-complexity protein [Brevundimonas alba]